MVQILLIGLTVKITENGVTNSVTIKPESLSEYIRWKNETDTIYNVNEFPYIYVVDKDVKNIKVYFDGNTPFTINSLGVRTNLSDQSVKYKKIILNDSNPF